MYSRGVARGGQGASAPLRKKDRIFFKRPIKNLALIEGTMLVDFDVTLRHHGGLFILLRQAFMLLLLHLSFSLHKFEL